MKAERCFASLRNCEPGSAAEASGDEPRVVDHVDLHAKHTMLFLFCGENFKKLNACPPLAGAEIKGPSQRLPSTTLRINNQISRWGNYDKFQK